MASEPIKTEPEGVNQSCRLCLSEESLRAVLEEHDVHQWISDYLSITISPGDRMSQSICAICEIRLNEFHHFWLGCQEVQNVLRSMIQDRNAEPDEVDSTSQSQGALDVADEIEQDHEQERHTRLQFEEATLEDIIDVRKIKIEPPADGGGGKLATKPSTDSRSAVQEIRAVRFNAIFLPVNCEVCSQTFLSKRQLRWHKQVVHQVKFHGCSVCEIGFAYRCHLTQHLQSKQHLMKKQKIVNEKGQKADGIYKPEASKLQNEEAKNGQLVDQVDIIDCQEVQIEAQTDDGFKAPTKASVVEEPQGITHRVTVECDLCLKPFPSSMRLWWHKKVVHQLKVHDCSVCRIGFRYRSHLNHHLRSKQHVANAYRLPLKSKSTRQRKRIKKESDGTVGPFKCDICDKEYRLETYLAWHKKQVHGTRPICHICGANFSNQSNLQRHLRLHYSESTDGSLLLQQISQEETDAYYADRPFKCDTCQKVFKRRKTLTWHTKLVHGPKLLDCHVCGYKCSSKYNFKRHVQTHFLGE